MIPVLFRYLCAKQDSDPAPLFVHLEGEMPAAPFPQLQVKPDASGRRFVVFEVQWDKQRPEVFTAYLARFGDANPLQPSIGLQEMLAAGWKLS